MTGTAPESGGAPTASPAADRVVDELLLRFARAAHRSGFPSDDLERRVEELGDSIGRPVWVLATPTLVEVAIGHFPHQRTSSIRVVPTEPISHLFLIGELDELAARVRHGQLAPEAALDELAALQPLHRSGLVVVGAYALAGGARHARAVRWLARGARSGRSRRPRRTRRSCWWASKERPGDHCPARRDGGQSRMHRAVLARLRDGDRDRHARRPRRRPAGHDPHDRHARARNLPPPLRGRQLGHRVRPARRARVRRGRGHLHCDELVRRRRRRLTRRLRAGHQAPRSGGRRPGVHRHPERARARHRVGVGRRRARDLSSMRLRSRSSERRPPSSRRRW